MNTIKIDYSFSNPERDRLFELLSTITANPFSAYPLFLNEVKVLCHSDRIPRDFVALCRKRKSGNLAEWPFIRLENCPIDQSLPTLDWKDAGAQKYRLKKTFVGEAFLLLFAELSETPVLSYRNVCNGDYIRDVHPEEGFKDTQSSKTITSFGFHKEIPIRPGSPDYVNLLGLRSYPGNITYTTFSRNKEVIGALSKKTADLLKQPIYQTPYSILSALSDEKKRQAAPVNHALFGESYEISYHQTRTTSDDEAGKMALQEFDRTLSEHKYSVLIQPGDFISFANKYCLHGRDVVSVTNEEELRHRWLIKTFNAHHLEDYKPYRYQNKETVIAN